MGDRQKKPGKNAAGEPASRPAVGDSEAVKRLEAYHEELRAQCAELQAAQRDLEQSRNRYVRLYDSAPVGYLTLDYNGVIEQANLAAAAMLGTQRDRLARRPLLVFVDGPDRQRFLQHLAICRKLNRDCVLELALRNGEKRLPVQLSMTPGRRGKGGGEEFLAALTDLSEQHRLEEERLAAERAAREASLREQAARAASEARDRFLAMLSHELRTPLMPVVAAISALERAALPPEVRPMVEMVRRNVEMETQLIDDLLDMMRVARGKLKLDRGPVDAHAAVDAAVAIIEGAGDKRIEIRTDLRAERHFVDADPLRLRQVVWNLLRNAVKFTPEGGWIEIGTHNPPTANGAAAQVAIVVRDTGIGIEPALLGRLFQPFEQLDTPEAKRTGLGLGLVTCRGIVEAHGGRIDASSEGIGKGAAFTITLPACQPPAMANAGQAPAHPERAMRPGAPAGRLRILLVEDHPDTARIMSLLLRAEGHAVVVADSVAAALESAGDADLLISDIGLGGESGLDLMRALRARGDQVPGIAVSGFGTDQDLASSRAAGFSDHLTKPVDVSKLLAAIDRVLATPAP